MSGYIPMRLLRASKTDWDSWKISNVLAPGRLAIVVDETELATQHALSAGARDYTKAITVWSGSADGSENVLLYAHEDVIGHYTTLHITSIASFNEASPSADPTNTTSFNSGMRFDYDDAVTFVKSVLSLDDEIEVDDFGSFKDTIDTRYRIPVGYFNFNANETISKASVGIVNHSTAYNGIQNGDDLLSVSGYCYIVYNPVTGTPFVGHARTNRFRDVNYIGLPFTFTRNGQAFPVAIWEACGNSSVSQYTDGKPVIYFIENEATTSTFKVLENQHSESFDLTDVIDVGDTVSFIDPSSKKWRHVRAVTVASNSVTVNETIENPFNETIYCNLWFDGPTSLNSYVDNDNVKLSASIEADDIEVVDASIGTHRQGSVDVSGSSFPVAYKTTGRLSVLDVNDTGFAVDESANYSGSWLLVDGSDNVTGITNVMGVVTDESADAARQSPYHNNGNVEHWGNKSGIIPGKTYLIPLSEREASSRFRSLPALLISEVVRDGSYLQLNFENSVPVSEFVKWLKMTATSISDGSVDDTDGHNILYLGLAQRAAVLETGLVRGRNTKVVNSTTVNKLIHSSGIRINNEPDQPDIEHDFGNNDNHQSAWNASIDPTSSTRKDKFPDVYNPRDEGRFTKIAVDQLGAENSKNTPITKVRLLRGENIKMADGQSTVFGVDRVGVSGKPIDNADQGVANITHPVSRILFDSTPLSSAEDRETVGNYSLDADVYDIRIGSEDNLDIYADHGSFPPTGMKALTVSNGEIVIATIPESFSTQDMQTRHGGNANGYDVYRITLMSMRVGWSFVLVFTDLGLLKDPHPNTHVVIEGQSYSPKTFQTQYPQQNIGDTPTIEYRGRNGSNLITQTKRLTLFGDNHIDSGTGINVEKRLGDSGDLLSSIPQWPLLYKITCIEADNEMLLSYKTRFLIEPFSTLPLHSPN